MFGVDCDDGSTALAGRAQTDLAAGDETLLVRQGQALAGRQGGDRGTEAGRSHHRVEHDVGLLERGEIQGSIRPQPVAGDAELVSLPGELLGLTARGKPDHLEIVGIVPDDVQRLAAYRARRSKDDDPPASALAHVKIVTRARRNPRVAAQRQSPQSLKTQALETTSDRLDDRAKGQCH